MNEPAMEGDGICSKCNMTCFIDHGRSRCCDAPPAQAPWKPEGPARFAEARGSVTGCKYYMIIDDENAAPRAMFREEFDATQWQYLQCPRSKIEVFEMLVRR